MGKGRITNVTLQTPGFAELRLCRPHQPLLLLGGPVEVDANRSERSAAEEFAELLVAEFQVSDPALHFLARFATGIGQEKVVGLANAAERFFQSLIGHPDSPGDLTPLDRHAAGRASGGERDRAPERMRQSSAPGACGQEKRG